MSEKQTKKEKKKLFGIYYVSKNRQKKEKNYLKSLTKNRQKS